jgi:hypothetical protein
VIFLQKIALEQIFFTPARRAITISDAQFHYSSLSRLLHSCSVLCYLRRCVVNHLLCTRVHCHSCSGPLPLSGPPIPCLCIPTPPGPGHHPPFWRVGFPSLRALLQISLSHRSDLLLLPLIGCSPPAYGFLPPLQSSFSSSSSYSVFFFFFFPPSISFHGYQVFSKNPTSLFICTPHFYIFNSFNFFFLYFTPLPLITLNVFIPVPHPGNTCSLFFPLTIQR